MVDFYSHMDIIMRKNYVYELTSSQAGFDSQATQIFKSKTIQIKSEKQQVGDVLLLRKHRESLS